MEDGPINLPYFDKSCGYVFEDYDWIVDMLGMTLHQFAHASDEEQFQAALRAMHMVVTTFVHFKAGYFWGLYKCFLIPE